MDRSLEVTSSGPCRHENPAGSINIKNSVNLFHRKSKGSSAMIISRGLVGPKPVRKSRLANRETG